MASFDEMAARAADSCRQLACRLKREQMPGTSSWPQQPVKSLHWSWTFKSYSQVCDVLSTVIQPDVWHVRGVLNVSAQAWG